MTEILMGLLTAVDKIDKHLTAIEKEYKKKNIEHRIREDWGYAYYTGKFVAYVYLLRVMINPTFRAETRKRIKKMGL